MSTTTVPPVLREVRVAAGPARAFAVFTGEMGRWWPLATHSVHGDRAVELTMGDGLGATILETDAAGGRNLWGTVTAWEPPGRVAFSWHPGRPPEEATDVEVRFLPDGGGTRVVLEHRGWQRLEGDRERRARYEDGWVPVLDRLAAHIDAT